MRPPSPARTAAPVASPLSGALAAAIVRGSASVSGLPAAAVVPGAASVSVRDLLTGPALPARVLADFGRVAYLDVGGQLLAVSGPGAVRLPFAVVLTGSLPPLDGEVRVGDGAVRSRSGAVEVRRWWRPPTPRPPAPVPSEPGDHEVVGVSRLAKALKLHDRRGRGERRTTADVVGRAARLERALVSTDRSGGTAGSGSGAESATEDRYGLRAAVAGLVGRGPGLTPAGDDVLAGALLAGHGTPVATSLATALPADLAARTTALAAALVRAAARGEGTPEGVALVDAVRGHGEVGPALDRLLALGHSSGADTALGILVGARAVAAGAGAVEAAPVGRSREDE